MYLQSIHRGHSPPLCIMPRQENAQYLESMKDCFCNDLESDVLRHAIIHKYIHIYVNFIHAINLRL